MSDWENFCDSMGWKNDENATDKLIDHIEGKNQKPYSSRQRRELTPEQKRVYAIRKEEERRFLSTPIGQHIASLTNDEIFNIKERTWTENGADFKSLYFEVGHKGVCTFCITITKCNSNNFTVEYCNTTARGRPPLCTKVSGTRLTRSLINEAISQNKELITAHNNGTGKQHY